MRVQLAFILLFIGLYASAQQKEILEIRSLEQALTLATMKNSSLSMNKLQLAKSEMELKLAKSARMPQISGSFIGQKNIELATTLVPGELFGQPGETVPVQFGQQFQYNAGITVNKPLIDLTTHFNIKNKKQAVEIRQLENAFFEETLKGQISYAYHALLISQEAILLAEKDMEIADSILQLTESKFEKGLIDRSGVLRSRINYNRVKQSRDEASLVYKDSHAQLKDLLALSPEEEIRLLESLVLQELNTDPTEMTDNLELYQSKLNNDRSKINLKQARSEYYPKVSLNAYHGSQLFEDEFNFSLSNDNWAPVQYIGLNVSVPLFNGMSSRRKVKIARLDAEIAAVNYESEKNRLEGQDQLLIENRALSASMTNTSFENYRLYKEVVELEYSRFKEGLVSLDVYLSVFDEYLNAKNAYLNALTTYHQYHAKVYARS